MPDGGDGARRRRHRRSAPAEIKRVFGPKSTQAFRKRMRKRLAPTSGGNAVIIDREVRSICRRVASDYTGMEIKKQLNGCDEIFALAAHDDILGARPDGTFERTFAHPMSRRLAVTLILFAYQGRRGTFLGRDVFVVNGFSRRTIGLMATERWCANAVHDADGNLVGPHINTVSRAIGRLRRSGLLLKEAAPHQHQYDARELVKRGLGHLCGPAKTNPDGTPKLDKNGDQEQWAFNHYYLTLCPLAPGTRNRIRPGRFDWAFRSRTAGKKYPAPEAQTAEGRVDRIREDAIRRRDQSLDDMLEARDRDRLAKLEAARATPAVREAAVRRVPDACWEDAGYMARMIAGAVPTDPDPPGNADS